MFFCDGMIFVYNFGNFKMLKLPTSVSHIILLHSMIFFGIIIFQDKVCFIDRNLEVKDLTSYV